MKRLIKKVGPRVRIVSNRNQLYYELPSGLDTCVIESEVHSHATTVYFSQDNAREPNNNTRPLGNALENNVRYQRFSKFLKL